MSGKTFADETWQKTAQVGKFASSTQDWAAIEAAAKKEGQVVIYSVSSRIAKLVDGFKEKYGIEIVGFDMPSDLQIEKLRREHKAGIHAVDVLFNAEAPLLLNEALPNNLVWNFIPSGLEPDLDAHEMEPFLVQRHSSRVVYYNTALNPSGAPIDSIWDLTREEWKGRTQLPSPLEDGLSANFIQTVLHNSAEMAAAYERVVFLVPRPRRMHVLSTLMDNQSEPAKLEESSCKRIPRNDGVDRENTLPASCT